ANDVSLDGRRQFAVLDHVGVAHDRCGGSAGWAGGYGLSIPYPAEVPTVLNLPQEVLAGFLLPPFDEDVGRRDRGRHVEPASPAPEAEAVARHQGAGAVLRGDAELLLRGGVVQHPLRLVEARQEPDELPVFDEVGPPGREDFAGDAFAAPVTRERPVVIDGEVVMRDLPAEPSMESRAAVVEACDREARQG